jgi:hypothetical protein
MVSHISTLRSQNRSTHDESVKTIEIGCSSLATKTHEHLLDGTRQEDVHRVVVVRSAGHLECSQTLSKSL